jgi:hypothetical protein
MKEIQGLSNTDSLQQVNLSGDDHQRKRYGNGEIDEDFQG